LVPTMLIAALIFALLLAGPIGQPANYHAFADQSSWQGLRHAGDVLSNIGFALVGFVGLVIVSRAGAHEHFKHSQFAWQAFCISLILTAAGSAWYHLAPDNFRLIFDRLPIALACASLLAAVRSDNVPGARGTRDFLLLAIFALASVGWWVVTEQSGHGDLRPYLALQFAPLVIIPTWQAIYQAPKRERLVMANAIFLYVAAKAMELSDHQVAELTGALTGHTLKHLLATAASAAIVIQLYRRSLSQTSIRQTSVDQSSDAQLSVISRS
ncbi:MAG: hypothetical protein WBD34_15810, partial [Burkholderiaceae bacterium]